MVRSRKQKAPRKRSGCSTCKSAHVRCQEERPFCSRCVRLGLKCGYETKLLWEDDAAQRNIAHGRAKDPCWNRHDEPLAPVQDPPHVLQYQFLNTSLADFEADLVPGASLGGVDEEEDSDVDEVVPQLAVARIPVPPHGPYHASDAFLLDYYINELSPKCSLSSTKNPYLYTLLPVAAEFEPLRYALLAAAANELRLQRHAQFEAPSLRLRDAAIRGLRAHLQSNKMDWESLAVMLMFCFFDISDGCAPSWMTHLKMGLRMLQALRTETRTDEDLKAFCEIYFVAHEVMGQTAWAEVASTVDYVWLQDSIHEIDVLMGCSRELISIIHRISCLNRRLTQHPPAADELIYEQAALINEIRCLEQHPAHGTNDPEAVLTVAEAKRQAALLHAANTMMEDAVIALDIDPSAVVESLVGLIAEIPTHSAAALWPLFVLGVSRFTSHDQHQFVIWRLLLLEQSRPLGSICHARRMVEAASMGQPLEMFRGPQARTWISLA